MNEKDTHFMIIAIELSLMSVKTNGGPFGAVMVRNGNIIAKASNNVTRDNDPTAHAEINAIRSACSALKTFDLSGCTMYTSCEPCPMCLAAIYWARITRIFYANTRIDAKNIGFDDSFIYDEIEKPIAQRSIPMIRIMQNSALKAFDIWRLKVDKIEY
jgi:tRNA(Arg) A34 adenosine deaminase TadA